MATTIITKNGAGAPLASDLVAGELAVDLTNKRLYSENSGGTVIELGTNPAAAVTFNNDVTFTGAAYNVVWDSSDNALEFADNAKAVFGAGADLQIYHDGSNSIVADVGTGGLFLSGSSYVAILNGDRSEYMLNANVNGEVGIYYDGSKKLATTSTGIDVTGTVTADGLTVESNSNATGAVATLSNTNVSTDSNTVLGNLVFESNDNSASSANAEIKSMSAGTGGQAELYLRTGSSGTIYDRLKVSYIGDISFYDSTGVSQSLFWDASAESLGIGTTSPASALELEGVGNATNITLDNTTATTGRSYSIRSGNTGNLDFYDNDATNARVTINSSGNVGIGTTSPLSLLHLSSTTGAPIFIEDSDATSTFNISELTNNAGNFGIQTRNSSGTFVSTDYQIIKDASGANYHRWFTGGSEKVRLDSSGNIGIGTASPASQVHLISANPEIRLQSSGASTTGEYSILSRDGSNVAHKTNIKNNASSLTFGTGGNSGNSYVPVERMRIDSSGRVGIGTSPDFPLHVSSTGVVLGLNATSGAVSQRFNENGTARFFLSTLNGSNGLSFVNGDGTSERMRIDASGNLLVDTTSATLYNSTSETGINLATDGGLYVAADGTALPNFNRVGSDGDIMRFRKDGTIVGSVSVTASATAYNTSSDQRLKDNIVDAPSASDDIDAIQVRSFDWKADGSHQKYGMVAQELVTVAPNAVSQPEDPEEMMGVDYSKLVPMLIKEVQQLRARVAQLEGAN